MPDITIINIQNGERTVRPMTPEEIAANEPTVEQVRVSKLAELKTLYNALLANPVQFGGKTFAGTAASKAEIAAVTSAFVIAHANGSAKQTYTLHADDGTKTIVSQVDLLTINNSMLEIVELINDQYWDKVDKVKKADTVAKIKAEKW